MNLKKYFYAVLIFFMLVCICSIVYAEGLQFEHVMNIGSRGSGEAQFKYVEDFAFDKNGNLLATDAANSNIQVFNKTTGEYITQFGGKGDEDHNFVKPEGIAVSPEGHIFVADYTTGYIKKFDENYEWLKTFSNYGEAPGENRKSEFMDIYEGLLYMAEAGNHRVDVFDLEGNFKFLFGGSGTDPGRMNNPEAAKVNSEGKVYVTDLKNDRMQVFSKDGKFLKTWGKTGTGPGEFKAPSGLAIDKDDNVYVCEIGNNRIQLFDKDGNFITMWGKKGSGNGEFGNLHGMIVDKTSGWVYVADTENNRIQVFKPSK
jgi:DNA-binding beta-propeller fold protein YncE